MFQLAQIRQLFRSIVRQRGSSTVLVLLSALGVGLTTTIFAIVQSVLLNPLPYPGSDRLVIPWGVSESFGIDRYPFSYDNFRDYRDQIGSLHDLAAHRNNRYTVQMDGATTQLLGARVTSNFFSVLGVEPILGRTFSVPAGGRTFDPAAGESGSEAIEPAPEESGPGAIEPPERGVVVLSYGLWQSLFGEDPGVLGETVRLDGDPYSVIGVMPPQNGFPNPDTQLFTPLIVDSPPDNQRAMHFLRLVGRLSDGASPGDAEQEMKAMAVRLAEAFPDANRELSVRVISLKDEIVGGSRRSLNILFSAVQVLFVIAWANIAILLLARGMARRGELRLRAALGATRARLFGLLLMEGVVLAGLGCALGLLAGSFAITALPQIDPALLPRAYEIGFSLPLVLWAFGLTLAGALLFGSIPAWAATGVSTAELDSTRTTGRRTSRLNSRLVAAQVALALPLLVASIMQLRSVHALESVELGYRIDHVLSAGVSLPGNQFGQAEQKHYIERAIDGFVRLPGVIAAGAISHLPLTNRQAAIVTYRPDQEGQSGLPNAHYRVITPGTLATLGIPVISGREFAPGDDETGRRIIVLNDRLARVLYPDREAVGQQVRLGTFEEPWEVIGVARSARLLALDAEPDYTIYVPVMQNLFASLLSLPQFLVRYEGSHVSLAPAVRQVLRDVDPNQAVLDIRPLGAQIDDWLGTRRAVAWLLWIIGGAALTLAGAGIYATLAFTVNRRRREMAIRSALGAAPGRLARTLVRDGLKPGVAGVVIGAAVCLIASRFFIGALFGVSSLDPPSMSGGIALVLLAALVACTAPTLRGMRQDPARLLREGEG